MTHRPSAAGPLTGRDAEISTLRAFVNDMSSVGNALIISCEPGMGGTSLLGSAISEARANGAQVIVISGAEGDRAQRFAGVRRLVARLFEASAISSAKRVELGALLADSTAAPSRLAVFTALSAALRGRGPHPALLVAVDDAHELDDASTEALAFVARRLRGSRTGLLVVTQARGGRLLARGHIPTLRIGSLPAATGLDLLASRFPDLSLDVRELLVATTEGMPLALVECAGALVGEQRVCAEAVPAVLPVSDRLRDLLAKPLVGLGSAARLMLLLLTLDSTVAPPLLLQVAGLNVRDALDPAVSAGVIIVRWSGAITFPRPMVRSAILAAATDEQRRHAHALLADAVADQVERRARHLALSVERPDGRVADALEDAAIHALLRNDGRAVRVAMSRASEMRRGTDGGRRDHGGFVASAAGKEDVSGAVRVDPHPANGLGGRLLNASLAFDWGLLATARQTLIDALAERGPDAADETVDYAVDLLLSICHLVGSAEGWSDFRRTIDLLGVRGSKSLSLVEQLSGPGADRSPTRLAELDSALDQLAFEDDPRVVVHLATAAVAVGRGMDCRIPLWRVLRHDTAFPRRVLAAALLAGVAITTGDSAEATRAVDHGLGLCRAAGHVPYAMLLRSVLAISVANVGDPALPALTGEVLAWATPVQATALIENARWALAREALSRSDHAAAHHQFEVLAVGGGLETLLEHRPEMAFDIVEAAAGSGHRALARTCAERAEVGLSSRLDFLALGAHAVANDSFETARTPGGTTRWPFDVARLRLVQGEHLERAGARELARDHLNSAMSTFQALQAEPWVTRAATRLRLAGEAVVGISQDRPLTERETTVVELAVLGLTNQEIANRLHLSARTVASHLYRIFDKIGVTSRAQLSGALATR